MPTDAELLISYAPIGYRGPPDRLTKRHASWQELLSRLLTEQRPSHIFRGQKNLAWDLVCSLERSLGSTEQEHEWTRVERGIFRRFIEQASPLLDNSPAEDDELGWLMLMQHFGAPTRLLDWSKSPLVALFFAYEAQTDPRDRDEEGKGPDRALWILDAKELRHEFAGPRVGVLRDPMCLIPQMENFPDQLSPNSEPVEPSVIFPKLEGSWRDFDNQLIRVHRQEFIRLSILQGRRADPWHPIPLLPPDLNPRMSAQQAAFTYDPSLHGGIPYSEIGGIHRIPLPDGWRTEVLTALRTMGVTASALFPGLDGAGRGAAMSVSLPYELEDLIGF